MKYGHAAEALEKGLECLRAIGFSAPIQTLESSKLLGESLLMRWTSAADRAVEVGYVATSERRPASLVVFISRGEGDKFSLEDWVRAKRPSVTIRFVAQKSESEEHFLKQFTENLCELFHTLLYGTLVATEWDAVPFDWKGYR